MSRSSARPQASPPPRSAVARTARLGRVAVSGVGHWAGDRLDRRGDAEQQRHRRGERILTTVDALVEQLARMRGAAMKAGQALSTIEIPGLDPEQSAYLQARLAALRDSVPPVEWDQMRQVLAAEWDAPPERVLAEIDPEPAAAASIGQVYRARARDGRELAVKVQYPGIAEAVDSDMRSLRLLAPLLRQLMPGLDVGAVLAELRERTVEECDYELEAQSHRRIARFWQDHPFVRVPAVDTELSRRRVLVSEWVAGMDFESVRDAEEPVRDRLVEIAYRFFYGTLRHLSLALGDPHPGNFLLGEDGRVAFVDFGMVRHLPADYLAREGRIAGATRAGQPSELVAAMAQLGYLPESWIGKREGELVFQHMRQLAWWLAPGPPLRLAPEDVWRATATLREEDAREPLALLRQMTVPPEALLLRRMEGLLFQTAATARAAAPWGALLQELIEGAPPATALGRDHARWLQGRVRAR